MALTVTPQQVNPDTQAGPVLAGALGPLSAAMVNVVGTGTDYVTGGYPLTPQQLGFMDRVVIADINLQTIGGSNNTGVIAQALIQANGSLLIKLFTNAAPPVELAAAVNTSGITYQIQAFGY